MEKKNNIKNRKLNFSLHTKKTNDINKLMQISYHSTLTKIQKLQKKKKLFSVPTGIARNRLVWPVFKPVQNVGISISVFVLVRYRPAGIAGTGTVSTTLLLLLIELSTHPLSPSNFRLLRIASFESFVVVL